MGATGIGTGIFFYPQGIVVPFEVSKDNGSRATPFLSGTGASILQRGWDYVRMRPGVEITGRDNRSCIFYICLGQTKLDEGEPGVAFIYIFLYVPRIEVAVTQRNCVW